MMDEGVLSVPKFSLLNMELAVSEMPVCQYLAASQWLMNGSGKINFNNTW
jgi:hypothetical protein